jgi:hypothetical protein
MRRSRGFEISGQISIARALQITRQRLRHYIISELVFESVWRRHKPHERMENENLVVSE